MTKILRFSLLSMLMMLCGSLFADEVKFDFSTDDAYSLFGLSGFSSGTGDNYVGDGDITEEKSIKSGDVTLTVAPSDNKTPNRMWKGSLRLYGGTLTVASASKNITAINFELNSNKWGNGNAANTGTIETGKWTGNAASVVISISANTQIKSMTVTLGEGGGTTDPDPDPTTARSYKKVTAVQSGKAYLIVAEKDGKMTAAQPVSASRTYGYLAVTDVTEKDGVITMSDATQDFVITASGSNFTIKQPDGRLFRNDPNYKTISVDETIDTPDWAITANSDGTFKIINASTGKWIQLDTQYGTYGCYDEEKGAMPFLYEYDGEATPTPDPQEEEIKDATIAEFNAAEVSTTVWYRLKGEVKNLQDGDKYGNFDLEDETGSVYVYGLLSEKGGEKQKFQELLAEKGIKNGCKITIIGNRGEYKDKIEVVNAYFVSIDEQAPAELIINGEAEFTESTSVTITPSDIDHDVYYTLDGSDPSDMSKATRYMEPFTISETCTVRAWEEDANLFAEKTFTKIEVQTLSVEEVIAAAPESTNAADGQQKVWVKGYIVGFVNGQALATGATFSAEGCEVKTNLLLATDPAETNVENCIPVQLPSGDVRNDLNLQDHADNYGKEVLLYGHVLKYFGVPGLKNVTAYEFTGNTSVSNIAVENAADGKAYNIAGQRVNEQFKGIVIKNGKKFVVK